MKKLYLLAIAFASTFSYGQLSEDFEGASLPAGWSTNIVTGGVDWTFGSGTMPTGDNFSSNAAIFNDDIAGESEKDNTVELISPSVDLTNYSPVNLSFEYALQDYAGSGVFFVHVWDGSAWVEIFTNSIDQNPLVVDIDVTAYKNAAFKVKFTYDDDDDWAWGAGVDNVAVTGTLGTDSFNSGTTKTTFYPNPTNGIVQIQTLENVTSIEVYGILGNLLKTVQNVRKVDLSELANGSYLVKVKTADGNTSTQKVIKN